MQRDHYNVLTDADRETYEFISTGPKGAITKVVHYISIAKGVYNLAFGDWVEETQSIRDDIRTNNADQRKVLKTVAFTVFDFMHHHPSAIVFATGSTPARTRLYQMGIAENLVEIQQSFDVEGYRNGAWETFTKGRNYDAFSLKAREKS